MSIYIKQRWQLVFDKLSQFNALDITTASLISNDKELIESGSLLAFLDKVRHTLSIIEDDTALTAFDELHMLGITRTDIRSKLDKLYDSVVANEELWPSDFLALGELIGELNALNRYSQSLSYHQNIRKKASKIGQVKKIKTLTYQQVAGEYYQDVINSDDYVGFDSWAIIAGVDKFIRESLDPKFLIAKQKSTQKIANSIGICLSRGKRSKTVLSQCETIYSYLSCNFSSDCSLIYHDILKANYQDIYGMPLPKEDRRLDLAFIVMKQLSTQADFQNLKHNVSLNVLVYKLIKGLESKFGVKSFDARTEIIYISNFYSKIPYYEPFYYQNNRKPMRLSVAGSGKLDELIFKIFKQTDFL